MNCNLVSILEKLNIDITCNHNINLKEFMELKECLDKFSFQNVICNYFIDKFIENVGNDIIEKKMINEKNNCFVYKYTDEEYIYFDIKYYKNYRDDSGIRIYWCGKEYKECREEDSYYSNKSIDINIMRDAILFFRGCPFFEKKISNEINIFLGNYKSITEDFINEKAMALAKFFLEKREEIMKKENIEGSTPIVET
jgi:hypothetical protein